MGMMTMVAGARIRAARIPAAGRLMVCFVAGALMLGVSSPVMGASQRGSLPILSGTSRGAWMDSQGSGAPDSLRGLSQTEGESQPEGVSSATERKALRERERSRRDELLRDLRELRGRVVLLPPPDGGALDGEGALLSRLWWQASPLDLASGTSGSYLGIGVADVTKPMATKLGLEEARGVVVTAVAEGSPAQKAGLKLKDVIVSYNGMRLEGRNQLTRMVGETPAERTINLSILRGGVPQEVKLTTAARRLNPDLKALREGALAGKHLFILPDLPRMVSIYRSPMLGIESEALSAQMAAFFGVSGGVLVREVLPESPAALAGLKAGDVIVAIAGEKVETPADITSILRGKSSVSEGLALGVVRSQKKLSLTVTPSGDWTEGRYFDKEQDGQWSRK